MSDGTVSEMREHRTILSLDASTVAIGWAVMTRDKIEQYGVEKLKGATFHERLLDGTEWLSGMFERATWDEYDREHWIVAIETPVIHRDPKKCNVDTTLHLAYMDGALMATALRHVSNLFEVKPGERLVALGLPANLPRKQAKEMVQQRVNAIYGVEISAKEHDASDAVAVGMAAIRQVCQKEGQF